MALEPSSTGTKTKLIDPRHGDKRRRLRIAGVVILFLGVAFTATGMVSFFAAFGGFGPPRFFWCCFVGLPLLFVGGALLIYGFMGAVARYSAGEMAPVATDTFNYAAQETREGVRTLATAVGEGLSAAAGPDAGKTGQVQVRCSKCNQLNDGAARFCNQCGGALEKTKACPHCGEWNDPDASYCDTCGRAVA